MFFVIFVLFYCMFKYTIDEFYCINNSFLLWTFNCTFKASIVRFRADPHYNADHSSSSSRSGKVFLYEKQFFILSLSVKFPLNHAPATIYLNE